jgi:methionyl aminopeptidase
MSTTAGGRMTRDDFRLRPNMTLTIEPMIVMGKRNVVILSDGWTIATEDQMPVAHVRHTIAVTDFGVEVLTP